MLAFLRHLKRDSRGATAIEYGLICALIVVACIISIQNVANKTTTMWNNVSTTVLAN
jgi:pilus assembly protein Flp/PilA